jgi:hypothetical protein
MNGTQQPTRIATSRTALIDGGYVAVKATKAAVIHRPLLSAGACSHQHESQSSWHHKGVDKEALSSLEKRQIRDGRV